MSCAQRMRAPAQVSSTVPAARLAGLGDRNTRQAPGGQSRVEWEGDKVWASGLGESHTGHWDSPGVLIRQVLSLGP